MRKNVNYAEMTCDFCGKVEHISQSKILPENWSKVDIPLTKYGYSMHCDLCPDCIEKLENIVECLKNHPEVDVVKLIENDVTKNRCKNGVGNLVTNLHGKCISNNMEQDWDFCK